MKLPGVVARSDEWVGLGRGADDEAVVEPLGLDELELTLGVQGTRPGDVVRHDGIVSQPRLIAGLVQQRL